MQQASSFGALVLLWLAGNALRLTVLAIPPVIALIIVDFHLSGTEVGLLNAIPVCLFALAAVPGSLLIARAGAMPAMIIGLLIAAAGSALRGFSVNVYMLYAGTVVMAGGIAVTQPALAPIVRQWVPNRIGFATAVYTNGLLFGEIFPVAFTAMILPLVGNSWRVDLALWSIPVAIIAVILLLFRPKGDGGDVVRHRRWMPEWKDPLLWQVGLMMAGGNQLYFCSNAFLPPYLLQENRTELIGPALTVLNVGQLPASFILLAMASRWERKKWPFLICGVLSLIGIAVVLTASTPWQIMIGAATIGFTTAALLTLGFALPALLVEPDDVARMSAGVLTIGYGASMIMSILCGVAWDFTHNAAFAFLPVAIGIVPIIMFGLMANLSSRRRGDAA